MARALLVFVDGIGLGRPGAHNPFDGAPVSLLAPLAGGAADARVAVGALDATLGHPGLPQSATGQATLFTGDDAVAVAGGHREGLPDPRRRAAPRAEERPRRGPAARTDLGAS